MKVEKAVFWNHPIIRTAYNQAYLHLKIFVKIQNTQQINISGAGHQGKKVKVDPQTQGSAEDAILQMSTYKRSNQASADVNSFPPPRPGSFITWVIW